MARTTLNLALLAAAAALVVTGILTYPAIPGGVLAAMIAVAALLVATSGRDTAGVTR